MVQDIDLPTNAFWADPQHNVILFSGKEPNLRWKCFADCIFQLCERFNVRQILFVGSVAGLTPHTREPRFTASISDDSILDKLKKMGIVPTDYAGPASFVSYMTARSAKEGFEMIVLAAEIPAYLQGYNPKCVETSVRCISSLLELHLPCDDLRTIADEFEKRVTDLVTGQPELAQRVIQLEEIYDTQIFDTEMGDLRNWLQQRGLRLD